jgi:hypothetical protein
MARSLAGLKTVSPREPGNNHLVGKQKKAAVSVHDTSHNAAAGTYGMDDQDTVAAKRALVLKRQLMV